MEGLKSDLKQLRAQFYCSSSDSDPDSDLETREGSQVQLVKSNSKGKGVENLERTNHEMKDLIKPCRSTITMEDVLTFAENALPTSLIEMAYAWERDILFFVTGLTYKEWINEKQWAQAWECAATIGKENLLAEIVIRGDLILQNHNDAYSYIGDYGCSSLLGLRIIERKLARRRAIEQLFWKRRRETLIVSELDAKLVSDISVWTNAQFLRWKAQVIDLNAKYQKMAWILGMITSAQERHIHAKMIDFHPSIHLSLYKAGQSRLQTTSSADDHATLVMAVIAKSTEVSYDCSIVGMNAKRLLGMTVDLENLTLPLPCRTDDKYLGRWSNLFYVPRNSPLLTFEALFWISKDHASDLRPLITSFSKMQHSKQQRRCITYPPGPIGCSG